MLYVPVESEVVTDATPAGFSELVPITEVPL